MVAITDYNSGRACFSDLHPYDGGWTQNPKGTVYLSLYIDTLVPFPISLPAAKRLFGARCADPTCIGGEAGGHKKVQKNIKSSKCMVLKHAGSG